MMHLGIWSVLFIIAVFDAKENRIPNTLVTLLLGVIFVHLYTFYGSMSAIPLHYYQGSAVAFVFCFILYLGGLMGAGDVKLIAAISLFVGLDHLLSFAIAIVLTGAVLSVFYLAQKFAISQVNIRQHVRNYMAHNIYGRLNKAPIKAIEMRIPFAPAIAVALAFYPVIS
ncbi:prepilin peptidase [Vibrio sp. 10N.222.51.C12]|uniref:A24 family peptidase n=1 Tax=unclassified Vibrio TaxID=2614977 RepID=UPI000C854E6B|nr:prepilin peptidase [Vibrio sp. 10N.286.48.B7]PMH83267.1 hypothetical protein BCU58_01655 [Vibrio sp. 10N.286.48.B7]